MDRMNLIYFIPLFGEMKIPKKKREEMCVFGFENYVEYEKRYLEISMYSKYRILILEDFFSSKTQDPLLASLFLLHLSFDYIIILQNEKVMTDQIDWFHFFKNGIFYGKSKENIPMELDEYTLIEKKIITSKLGKMDLGENWIFESLHLKDFFEKHLLHIENIDQIKKWKDKNLFRHYIYDLILRKRIHLYSLDEFSEKELEIFQKDFKIPFS